MNKAKELVASNQNLQKKVEESKKLTESIEQKRKSESLKYYLESKIAQYPKYEAALLRKHFANAKSQAEIDENFSKVLAQVGETRDAMRNVQNIQVAPVKKQVNEAQQQVKKISGETIVTEDGGNESDANAQMIDESFVDIDNDVISNEEMQRIISWL